MANTGDKRKQSKNKTGRGLVRVQVNDDCYIYLRGKTWQFYMNIPSEGRPDRSSLKTDNKALAMQRAVERYARNIVLMSQGKRIFSITLEEAVDLYLDYRKNDVYTRGDESNAPVVGNICAERWKTIRYQLQPLLRIYGAKTRLVDITPKDGEIYPAERYKDAGKPLQKTTMKNEQSIINSMFKWLQAEGYTDCSGLLFRKISYKSDDHATERDDTFSVSEAQRMIDILTEMLAYDISLLEKAKSKRDFILAAYFLVALESGLRAGEQKQLRWAQVESQRGVLRKKDADHSQDPVRRGKYAQDKVRSAGKGAGEWVESLSELPFMKILGSTSKVNRTRLVPIARPDIFERLRKYHEHQVSVSVGVKKGNALQALRGFGKRYVFSIDGQTLLTNNDTRKFLQELLEKADIRAGRRKLTPGKCRKYAITQKLAEGKNIATVAKIMGTSIAQIEKTYHRARTEDLIEYALG